MLVRTQRASIRSGRLDGRCRWSLPGAELDARRVRALALGRKRPAYATARLTHSVSCSPVSRSSELKRSHPCIVRPPIAARVALAVAIRAPLSAGSTWTRTPPWPLARAGLALVVAGIGRTRAQDRRGP